MVDRPNHRYREIHNNDLRPTRKKPTRHISLDIGIINIYFISNYAICLSFSNTSIGLVPFDKHELLSALYFCPISTDKFHASIVLTIKS